VERALRGVVESSHSSEAKSDSSKIPSSFSILACSTRGDILWDGKFEGEFELSSAFAPFRGVFAEGGGD
jgi:hypothetical protein